MRKYKEKRTFSVEKIYCNMCGKEMTVVNGVIREGVLSVDKSWGYFSDKDGQVHSFDLCEECYDKFIGKFQIPVEIVKEKELI
ncbi:hypothetical protein [Diplocloster modestus]|uniref:Uncharacterized protein n=1 Tax=Diplocloster modestus TaxID=2850322 RepID=A0ABS6K7C1_9FIRM|nr:hypothetical protein [Diplocloster modestus]MBU9726409.1 hypothetical protein [Diplocloster modestus]